MSGIIFYSGHSLLESRCGWQQSPVCSQNLSFTVYDSKMSSTPPLIPEKLESQRVLLIVKPISLSTTFQSDRQCTDSKKKRVSQGKYADKDKKLLYTNKQYKIQCILCWWYFDFRCGVNSKGALRRHQGLLLCCDRNKNSFCDAS